MLEILEPELEDFRKYLLSRGYREGNVSRIVSLTKRILEAGGPERAEEAAESAWMRRKIRYAWRKWEEYAERWPSK